MYIKRPDGAGIIICQNELAFTIDIFQIWREYDTDGSGYIEADELKVNNDKNIKNRTLITLQSGS